MKKRGQILAPSFLLKNKALPDFLFCLGVIPACLKRPILSVKRSSLASGSVLKYSMSKKGYLYILASGRNGTLYRGNTSNLVKRIEEHMQKLADGFTKRHDIAKIVCFF